MRVCVCVRVYVRENNKLKCEQMKKGNESVVTGNLMV